MVESGMFGQDAAERVWVNAYGGADGQSLWVTLADGEYRTEAGQPTPAPEVRLLSRDWGVRADQVTELCEAVLGGPGVIPDGVGIGGDGCVDVPLVDGRSEGDRVVWPIADALALVHTDRDEAYFEVADGTTVVCLGGVDGWRTAQALASLAEWQRDLEGDYAEAASERRRMLRGGRSPERLAVFAARTAVEVDAPAGQLMRCQVRVTSAGTVATPLPEAGDPETLVELVCDRELRDGARSELLAVLLEVRGVVALRWRLPLGRASVPFLPLAESEPGHVAWEIGSGLLLVLDEHDRLWLRQYGARGGAGELRLRLTWRELRRLTQALATVPAWREELALCAAVAMAGRRLERGVEVERAATALSQQLRQA